VRLQVWTCNESPSQDYVYRANSGTLYHPASGLCVEPVAQVETGDPAAGPVQLAVCDGQQKQVPSPTSSPDTPLTPPFRCYP